MSSRWYAIRRLNPFLGTIQVLHREDARAISYDGEHWQLQLRSLDQIPAATWGNLGALSAMRRYFVYGSWTSAGGVERVPVNPILGDPSTHPALQGLLGALEDQPALPFALADTVEFWLLDECEGMPLALLRSCLADDEPDTPNSLRWHAAAPNQPRFESDYAKQSGQGEGATALLRRAVEQRGGALARGQWFARNREGAGVGLAGVHIDDHLQGRRLPVGAFPPCLLNEHGWDEEIAPLVRDYFDWLAPLLLTLPDLSRERRAQLEAAGAKDPVRLWRYHRLYPEIVDHDAVDPALVEAVMRRSL